MLHRRRLVPPPQRHLLPPELLLLPPPPCRPRRPHRRNRTSCTPNHKLLLLHLATSRYPSPSGTRTSPHQLPFAVPCTTGTHLRTLPLPLLRGSCPLLLLLQLLLLLLLLQLQAAVAQAGARGPEHGAAQQLGQRGPRGGVGVQQHQREGRLLGLLPGEGLGQGALPDVLRGRGW